MSQVFDGSLAAISSQVASASKAEKKNDVAGTRLSKVQHKKGST